MARKKRGMKQEGRKRVGMRAGTETELRRILGTLCLALSTIVIFYIVFFLFFFHHRLFF